MVSKGTDCWRDPGGEKGGGGRRFRANHKLLRPRGGEKRENLQGKKERGGKRPWRCESQTEEPNRSPKKKVKPKKKGEKGGGRAGKRKKFQFKNIGSRKGTTKPVSRKEKWDEETRAVAREKIITRTEGRQE